MFSTLIISALLVTLGYGFSALLLLAWALSSRRSTLPASLAKVSNALLAFFALCSAMITGVEIFNQRSVTLYEHLAIYLAIVIVMAFPNLRQKPLWLLLPMGIIINLDKVLPGYAGTITLGLWGSNPLGLLIIGVLYCLLLVLLYLISLWIRRIMATEPPPERLP